MIGVGEYYNILELRLAGAIIINIILDIYFIVNALAAVNEYEGSFLRWSLTISICVYYITGFGFLTVGGFIVKYAYPYNFIGIILILFSFVIAFFVSCIPLMPYRCMNHSHYNREITLVAVKSCIDPW